MNPARLTVRFPAREVPDDLAPAIETFHRFIQRGLVEGLVLDVADYRHVPQGPGVLLVGHDVDYAVAPDAFTVVRKQQAGTDVGTQLRDALRMGLGALAAIEDDPSLAATFDRGRFTLSVRDRGLGPRAEVAARLRDEVTPILADLYGDGVAPSVVQVEDERELPEVYVEVPSDAADAVLGVLGGSRAPLQSPWDIRVEELARLRSQGDAFVLLDVREPSEYEQVNLGGTLLPLGQLAGRLGELDREAKVVVHCRAGRRGATAVAQLREAGFTDAWNVNGALVAWRERIDPTLRTY